MFYITEHREKKGLLFGVITPTGVGLKKMMLNRGGHMKKRTEKHPKTLKFRCSCVFHKVGLVTLNYTLKRTDMQWSCLFFLHVQLQSSQCTMP